MHQRCTFLGAGGQWIARHGPTLAGKFSSLKRHSLMLRPILRKSAVVTFTPQFKTIGSNNFRPQSVFNVLFPKCVAHKKKSCVYFSTSPYIHLFPRGT